MSAGEGALRLLHVAASFARDEERRRVDTLLDLFGPRAVHSFASAGGGGAAARLKRTNAGEELTWPALAGSAGPLRLQKLAEAMCGYDLVLTYNWGAMNAVLSHTAFGPRLGLAPLIHHEDRLEQDEIERRKTARNLRRMLALARVRALVVPSQRVERIAIAEWKLPQDKVRQIAPGIAVADYRRPPRRDALPRVIKRPGELFLGTLAAEADVGDLLRLVGAAASLPEPWQLVIIGHTPAAEAVVAEAVRLAIGHRVHLTGPVAQPGRALGLCDLFAWLGDGASFPVSVTEAMAAGLAVAGVDRGDATAALDEGSRRFLVPPGDGAALARALGELAAGPALRAALGRRNRERAAALFDRAALAERHAAVCREVLGRDGPAAAGRGAERAGSSFTKRSPPPGKD